MEQRDGRYSEEWFFFRVIRFKGDELHTDTHTYTHANTHTHLDPAVTNQPAADTQQFIGLTHTQTHTDKSSSIITAKGVYLQVSPAG